MSCECDEAAAFYNETRRKANKVHKCYACKEPIRPKDLYWYIAICGDGRVETIKRCLRCQALHELLRGMGDSLLWPAERLNCGEEFEQHWGFPPPEELQELAFLTHDEAQEQLR